MIFLFEKSKISEKEEYGLFFFLKLATRLEEEEKSKASRCVEH
jgi:hypothetical protein